ncbi:hypothetical protein ACFORG_00715 [Lutimaribacter marinistellae]|uniref:Autotransporter domain-containing protein n=1 Tax=Lutimaribacter marinistellae TaxID=1820329 RepID=A0ABV7TAU1_9RHOB
MKAGKLLSVSVVALMSNYAWAFAGCETSTSGPIVRSCTGEVTPPDTFTVGAAQAGDLTTIYSVDQLTADIVNSNITRPAFSFAITRPVETTPGLTDFYINQAAPFEGLTIQSLPLSVLEVQETGLSGGNGGNSTGSGNKSGGSGGAGASLGTFNSGINSVTLSIPSGTPDNTFPATVAITGTAGNGGTGGEGKTGGFGDGYGGRGGNGGSTGDFMMTFSDASIAGLPSSPDTVQPNPYGGMSIGLTGGAGGAGGYGQAADYTGGGGSGGTGGAGSSGTTLTFKGNVSFDAALFGLSVTSQGGAGGQGGGGHNTLTQTARGGQGGTGGVGGAVSITAETGSSLDVKVVDGPGIFVESLAGKGGRGGNASTSIVGGSAFGGGGGIGGAGGVIAVDLTNDTNVQTTGDSAPGFHLRSHGGAGGDGGTANGANAEGGGTRGAGPAARVALSFGGTVDTTGDESDAVFLQSVGGFSGNAGNARGIYSYGAGNQSAGGGGEIDFTFEGADSDAIKTGGDNSDAVFAQSIGGGGGKGTSASGIESLSGSGAAGGSGSNVTLSFGAGSLITEGERSRGLVAQSIGGTGGDSGSAKGVVSIGGTGAAGGSGGAVTVTNSASVTTAGVDAIGVLAQSVGGGGGAASSAGGLVALGGAAANGATGGTVDVSQFAAVETTGDGADALFAQSIGGSGGHGSNTVAAGSVFTLAISGQGGAGGNGGEVSVDTDSVGTVSTSGDNARGIVATSTGGGGGHAGNAISASGFPIDVSIALGADGGSAGQGGAVSVNALGGLSTTGANATALMATSTGGSGGSAATTIDAAAGLGTVGVGVGGSGSGGGNGGTVTVCRGYGDGAFDIAACNKGTIPAETVSTTGDIAGGVHAASVGGGGGHSGTTLSASAGSGATVSVGGDGGGGGTGAAVSVFSSGGITTEGVASPALIAKSVGGNGGSAFLSGSVDVLSQVGATVSVGGSGGSSGGAGEVTVVSTDTVATSGDHATGIQGISQAGSGGVGGMALAMTGLTAGSANVAIGGKGGGGHAAGDVMVDYTGTSLTTTGDQAAGILAQSSGGSGGAGGLSFAGQGIGVAAVGVSLGGDGGTGGTAGQTQIVANGAISTTGSLSDGIAATSQGGNGGRGGTTITGDGASQASAEVTIGGGGGNAGTAELSHVILGADGSVATTGTSSAGIRAKSLGGNGGVGGVAVEAGLNLAFSSEYPVGNASVTLGGDGGNGGTSGAVTVESDGAVQTSNLNSHGISAQSIAGSGGAGGMSIAGSANVGAAKNIDASVTIGGGGGTGGAAGDVRVVSSATGSIKTTGDNADGVLAQSIGGNGGAGGNSYNILANVASGGTTSVNLGVTIGGAGGGGGQAGTVTVSNENTVSTTGTEATGLYAQSVGGHGGKGGAGGNALFNLGPQAAGVNNTTTHSYTIDVAVGGAGGNGALGGDVSVTNADGATVMTGGSTSYGIFAQSVGGNGGDGGSASNFGFTFNGYCNIDYANQQQACQETDEQTGETKYTNHKASIKVAVGGSGGTGNHAGAASVTNGGLVETTGENAHAVLVQSVGGSGGTGGSTLSSPVSSYNSSTTGNQIVDITKKIYQIGTAAKKLWAGGSLNVFVGGSGGAAGDGDAVSVTGTGNAATKGKGAYAIFAQSVGGGGGSGGSTNQKMSAYALRIGGSGAGGGDGGKVQVSVGDGAIAATEGDGAKTVFAQSVGGGGGDAGSHFSIDSLYFMNLQIGGSDGVAGAGGDVEVSTGVDSFLLSSGREATGIFAQSIGGGGGQHSGGGDQASGTVIVGGATTGTASGNGGEVVVTSQGAIGAGENHASDDENDYTTASHGIFAQSVGGGGGYGGSVLVSNPDRLGTGLTGTSGNATGDGGSVTVTHSGSIDAYGKGSIGIFAQSVGGGGGVQGGVNTTETDAAYVGSFGGSGAAGTVSVSVAEGATVSTTGAYGHGVFAQYAGGNDTTRSASDTTLVTVDGQVQATGVNAYGVYGQSAGHGAGQVNITVGENGEITGSTGVFVNAATTGLVTNKGSIGATGGVSGVAIHSAGGALTVSNAGTITGSVTGNLAVAGIDAIALGQNGITLENTGTLVAGDRLETQSLTNSGVLHVGGANSVGETLIQGTLTNTDDGLIVVDVDTDDPVADYLAVGGAADLEGAVKVRLSGAGSQSSNSFDIVGVTGGLNWDGLEVLQSPTAFHSLTQTAGNRLRLSYGIDFANAARLGALSPNQASLAQHLDDVYVMGALGEELTGVLLSSEDTEAYSEALDVLGASVDASNRLSGINASLRFVDSLFSCADSDGVLKFFEDGQCYYFDASVLRYDRDRTNDLNGFSESSYRFKGGTQLRSDNGLVYGVSLSYEARDIDFDGSDSASDASHWQAGASVKRYTGNWELGAGVFLGHVTSDNARDVGFGLSAKGEQEVLTYGAEFRADYMIDQGNWFLKPGLGVGVLGLEQSGYTETTSTGVELRVEDSSDTLFYIRPSIEVGGQLETANGMLVRPKFGLAVSHLIGDNSVNASASLASSPNGVNPFDWSVAVDRTRVEISAGVDVFTSGDALISVNAIGAFSDNSDSYGVGFRIAIPF